MLSAETYDLQNAVNELLKAENESHSSRNCVRFPEGASVCVCVCAHTRCFLHVHFSVCMCAHVLVFLMPLCMYLCVFVGVM